MAGLENFYYVPRSFFLYNTLHFPAFVFVNNNFNLIPS